MPNYNPSNLAKAQAKLVGQFQAGELRFREPAVFKSLIRNASIMFPDYNGLRTREDRAVEAYFAARSARALTGARSHNHVGPIGDSAVLTPSWSPFADGFATSLKRGDNNVYNNVEILQHEMSQVIANFAEGLEAGATSFLFSNRSQVNAGSLIQGVFNAGNDAFEITEATEGDRAMQITKSNMGINKYNGAYDVYCDTIAFDKFEKDANQGAGNSTNLQFNFTNTNFIHSVDMNALAAGLTYTKGFWIAVPVGMAAALPWIPLQNRQGIVTKENMYGTFANPVDALQYGVHSYEERSDTSGTNGQTQDVTTEWQISLDVAFDHAPLTAGAGETPLMAFALV